MHIAAADGAPGLEALVMNIAIEFGVAGSQAAIVTMDDTNTDWNSLYPFSAVSLFFRLHFKSEQDADARPFVCGSSCHHI